MTLANLTTRRDAYGLQRSEVLPAHIAHRHGQRHILCFHEFYHSLSPSCCSRSGLLLVNIQWADHVYTTDEVCVVAGATLFSLSDCTRERSPESSREGGVVALRLKLPACTVCNQWRLRRRTSTRRKATAPTPPTAIPTIPMPAASPLPSASACIGLADRGGDGDSDGCTDGGTGGGGGVGGGA